MNTGAFDPLEPIAAAVDAPTRTHGCTSTARSASGRRPCPGCGTWSPGVERADSWATDAHKWLNIGYDCGFVAVRDPDAHRVAMATSAAYLLASGAKREGWEYVLDSSRRARGLRACTRPSARSAGRACATSSSAAARWPAAWPTTWPPSPASRS